MNNETCMCRVINCLQTADMSSRITRLLFRCVETTAAGGHARSEAGLPVRSVAKAGHSLQDALNFF
jgi:hypothetical protein